MNRPPWQGTDGQQPSDEALVAAYVQGLPEADAAFDLLVERHERRVYAICLRYFGNPADAEDAAQDTFITVMRRASGYRGTARFSTWLYRVTVNACNDLARRRARRPKADGTDIGALADLAAPEDPLDARELSPELEDALAQLDPTTRDAIIMHDVHGLPYADVGTRLNLPVGTVKSRIHRGHARLAAFLRTQSGARLVADTPERGEPLPPSGPPRR